MHCISLTCAFKVTLEEPLASQYLKMAKVWRVEVRDEHIPFLRPLQNTSSGMDGVRLWNIRTKMPLALPPPQNLRGPVTCLKWISHRDEAYDLLCFGTSLGYLVLWRRQSERVSMYHSPQVVATLTRINSNLSTRYWADALAEGVR